MTYPTTTGVLRKWQRKTTTGVQGSVYESDIWDDGAQALLFPGKFVECATYYLFVMGTQTYKLPKDEEIV